MLLFTARPVTVQGTESHRMVSINNYHTVTQRRLVNGGVVPAATILNASSSPSSQNDITATLYTPIANSDDRPVLCTMFPQVSDQVGVA